MFRLLLFLVFLSLSSLAFSNETDNKLSEQREELIQKAQDDGTVKVIVKLKVGNTRKYKKPASVSEIEGQRIPIQNAQNAFLSRLKSGMQGKNAGIVSDIIQYKTIPFIAITLDEKALRNVYSHPLALGIIEDKFHKLALAESVPWSHGGYGATIDEKYDGSGWAVVIIDDGIKIGHHHFLKDLNDPMEEGIIDPSKTRIVDGACFSRTCPGGLPSPQYGIEAAQVCWDSNGPCNHHGTHVTGIAAGSQTNGNVTEGDDPIHPGVAPGANIIPMNILSERRGPSGHQEFGAYLSRTVLALERTYELSHLVDTENGFQIAAVNMSYGGHLYSEPCFYENYYPIDAIADHLQVVQIAIVAASGNDSSENSVTAPACHPSVIAVGSTLDDEYTLSHFSNHGDLVDLLAPGHAVTSSTAHSRTSSGGTGGTSMASPHVTGAFAVLRQARPDASVSNIHYALKETGIPISVRQDGTDTGIAKPLIDTTAAKSLLLDSTFELKPDLIVQTPVIRYDEFNWAGNYQFNLYAPVKNIGSEDAPSTNIYFYLSTNDVIGDDDDITLGTDTVSALPFNDIDITRVRYVEVDPLTHYWVGACVNPVSAESDNDNNCSIIELRESQPDLRVVDVTRSDSTVSQGQQLSLTSTTQNFGMNPSPATTMQFYLSTDSTITTDDAILLAPLQVASIPPNGGEYVNSIIGYAPYFPGYYWIGACVDQIWEESNIDNNCSLPHSLRITEDRSPDMTIDGKVRLTVHSDNGMIHPGTELTLYANAKNIGQATNNSDAKVTVFLSDDIIIRPNDTSQGEQVAGRLDVDETQEHSFSIIAPDTLGNHFLGACIKLSSYEGELNLDNNCSSSVEFLVSDPSLAD